MNNEIEDGSFAFPVSDTVHPNGQVQYGSNGMKLRDYFAADAMKGICGQYRTNEVMNWDAIANGSYMMADAMLAARSKA